MIRRAPLLCLVYLFSLGLLAQNPASHWVQGEYRIDFRGPFPKVSQQEVELNPFSSAAAISDADGELLFYTDGSTVYNRDHLVMPGGQLENSDTMYFSASVIVPQPGDPDRYYILSVQPAGNREDQRSGLFYSVIDRTLDGGRGGIVSGPTRLSGPVAELLSAYHSAESGTTWIMVREAYSDRYHAFSLTDAGLATQAVTTSIGSSVHPYEGQLKFSPDGRHVAVGYGTFGSAGGQSGEGVQLFDFDERTGRLSNDVLMLLPQHRDVASVEFSSDGTLLYAFQSGSTYEQALYQYDITVPRAEVDATRYQVARPDVTGLNDMQLAANGKIYLAKGGGQSNGLEYLAVVHDPNRRGRFCDFVELGLHLAGANARYDTPLFRQDLLFRTYFTHEPLCAAGSGAFTVTNTHGLLAARWEFGDGATASGTSVSHRFTAEGKYEVILYAEYSDRTDTIRRSVRVYPETPLDLGADRQQCRGSELLVGSGFSSYAWNTGDTTAYTTVTEAGSYQLTVTNADGCQMTDSVRITLSEPPVIDLPDTAFLSPGGNLTLDPGAFASYDWSTGATTRTLRVDRTGWYSVRVSDAAGCTADRSVYVGYPGDPGVVTVAPRWLRLNPQPSGRAQRDVAFLDRNTGFVAGDGGLFETRDAGGHWEPVAGVGPGVRLAFADGIGYLVGERGFLYRSTHGGRGWNKLITPVSGTLNAISLLGRDTLYLTTEQQLLYSENGGADWAVRNIADVHVNDSYFLDRKTGFVAGREGVIRKTTNGGGSWTTVYGPTSRYGAHFIRIYFVNARLGFAAYENGGLVRTDDGGATWQDTDLSALEAIHDFDFQSDRYGFAVGEYGAAYVTEDGGLTWSLRGADAYRAANDLYGVSFTSDRIGYAVGLKGRILKTVDAGQNWIDYATTYEDIVQLDFPTVDTGYALARHRVYKTVDRGDNWSIMPSVIAGEKVTEIDFVSATLGYAIAGGDPRSTGGRDEIYRTEDGGQSWTKTHSSTVGYYELASLTFRDRNNGFVTDGSGNQPLFRTTDGGATWKSVEAPRVGQLQFLDDTLGFGINPGGYGETLYRTTDGGDTWVSVLESDEDLQAFHFVDASVGYAVGDNAYLARTRDGGGSWQRLQLPYEYYVDVKFMTRDTGYVLDEEGVLFKTTNGGISWTEDNRTYGISSIETVSTDAYLAGRWGCILTNRGERLEMESPAIAVDHVDANSATITANLPVFRDTLRLSFRYGTAPDRLDRVQQLPTLGAAFSGVDYTVKLEGLTSATTYYGRFAFDDGRRAGTSQPVTFSTTFPTALRELDIPELTAVPNPVHRQLTLRYTGPATDRLRYQLYSPQGIEVTAGTFYTGTGIDVSTLPPGVYTLLVRRDGVTARRRIVVTR